MSDIQSLRNRFEFWQTRYRMTKNYRYYSLFQHYFKEYMRLINSGAVPRSVIEKMVNKGSCPKQEDNITPLSSRKVSVAQGMLPVSNRISPREESLLVLFSESEESLSLRDIQQKIPFSRTHLRDILRSLVQKRRLEEERVKGRSVWKKRCS